MPRVANVVVSNVPGPPFPIYACGARVSGIYASSVLLAFAGLNITLMSYIDRIDFGLTSDPDLLEDPWEIADGIQDALAELMEAAGPRQADAGVTTRSTPDRAGVSDEDVVARRCDRQGAAELAPSEAR